MFLPLDHLRRHLGESATLKSQPLVVGNASAKAEVDEFYREVCIYKDILHLDVPVHD